MNSSLARKPRLGRQLAVGLMTAGVLSVGLASPASAAVANAVTEVPSFINIANQGHVVIKGTADSTVTAVRVVIDDGVSDASVTGDITLAGNTGVQQSWSTTMNLTALVDSDNDGDGVVDQPLTIISSYDGGDPPTTDPTVVKDTLEPGFPSALPDDVETFPTATDVEITSLDPADQDRTHFNVDTAADPTAASPVVPALLPITHSQQVKAISFDEAGNPSEIMTMNFVVTPPVITPPVITPPVITPPVITPPVVKPPVVKPKPAVVKVQVMRVSAAGNEFVSVKNTGKVAFNLKGWKLKDRSGNSLTLKSYNLKPGATVKVYTGKGTNALGKSFLGKGKRTDVWSTHDTVKLYNTLGVKVASMRY